MLQKGIFFSVLALVLVFGTGVASANHAWTGKKNQAFHWAFSAEELHANPLELGDNLTALWEPHLNLASSDWNTPTNPIYMDVLETVVAPGGSVDAELCDPVLGRVEVCNAEYGDNGWLGIASIWIYNGKDNHIAQGTVQVNDTYFNTPTYNSDAWRNLVMCQEVGHVFGLGHQDENFNNPNLGTCMDYTSDPTSNQHPNDHDFEMLQEIYAHHNGTDGGSDDGGSGNNGKGNGRGKPAEVGAPIDLSQSNEWGVAIRQINGKDAVFERNLGNGMSIITHVFWTLEEYDHGH